ncbi:glycosyl hydrolase [Kineococcus rhizosphaerae]|uniref:Glycosyl hydrolase family 26 n=1 Tax=Kineococcus rhizosphaerae TaxID=559628 RepID=A0A2T0R123_9ACTN|nr:glycosyl hydrolase [Kineococcus rhizosphaerae]PRY12987.1 glycosyl hydrolase family 26 [Kineococcus rhizosphaerae]
MLGSAVTLAVTGDGSPEASVRPSSERSGLPWPSGGSDDAGIAEFERWRGRRADVRVMWNSTSTWAEAEPAQGLREAREQGEPRLISYAVPLVTEESGQDLRACAAGANDRRFRVMARNVVDNGFGSAIVRIGWEGSASWYPWGVTNPVNGGVQEAQRAFREGFRRCAAAFREVAPDVRIELNYGSARGRTNVADVYPGDEYVDVVGNDVYLSPDVRSAQDWQRACRAGTAERPVGLQRYAEFARAHGKLFAVAEWGLDTTEAPDADAVAYVEGMARLFRDHRDVLAYEGYYNRTNDAAAPCRFRLDEGCNPAAAAAYLRLFGAAATAA